MSDSMTPEYAVHRATERTSLLKYPIAPAKPKQLPGESHTSYGGRLDQWELLRKTHSEAVSTYHAEQRQINADFAADLLAALGLTDHPKGNTLYSMAYERGHSSGYSEVALIAEELSELLK